MTTIALPNVPDDLYARLDQLARAQQRTVAEEVLRLLEKSVQAEEHSKISVTEILEDLARWRGSVRIPPGTPDSVELLREDRER